jgi:coatomer protein complex subunit alpha (xenin)
VKLLNRQVGAVNFAPLKELFLSVWTSAQAYVSCNDYLPALSFAIHRNPEETGRNQILPFIPIKLETVFSKVQDGFAFTTAGKIEDALMTFKNAMNLILLTIVNSPSEVDELHKLLKQCQEYALGLSMEMEKRGIDSNANPKRALELASYFAHCQLQPEHLMIILRQAMVLSFKLRNYATAYIFANRLMGLNPAPQIAQQVKKMINVKG